MGVIKMIKFENTEVMGWEAAIRGMRNPMNSWEKSDSYPAVNCGGELRRGCVWCVIINSTFAKQYDFCSRGERRK